MFDVLELRKEFPILSRKVNNKPLIYLDNGASSQKPISVIEAVKNCYETEYSNVHRGYIFYQISLPKNSKLLERKLELSWELLILKR